MKRIMVLLFAFMFLWMLGCSKSSSSEVIKLNFIKGNKNFVSLDGNLSQIIKGSGVTGVSSRSSSVQGVDLHKDVISVTTDSGMTSSADNVIQVNDQYVLVQNLVTHQVAIPAGNYILDTDSGDLIPLNVWPDNVKKIAASKTEIFFVSGGTIYEVVLATGAITTVSTEGVYFNYNWVIGRDVVLPWSRDCFLFINGNGTLFVYSFYGWLGTNSSSVQIDPEGQAARLTKVNGAWTSDISSDKIWYNLQDGHYWYEKMDAGSAPYNCIPGNVLIQSNWLITDPASSTVYDVNLSAPFGQSSTTVHVYKYDFNTWSDGDLVLTQTWTNPNSGNIYVGQGCVTFIGSSDICGLAVLTDSTTIFTLSSDGNGSVILKQTPVSSGIPVSNTVGQSTFSTNAAVTNWDYFNDMIYILNPGDSLVYSWDLVSTFSLTNPVGDPSRLHFYY